MAKYEGKTNDRLRRIMGESAAKAENRVSVTTKIPAANPLKNQTSVLKSTQKRIESVTSPERIGQKNSNAYQQIKRISAGENTTKKRNGWEFKPDGTRKSFNELTTPEVLTWIGTLPEEERGSAARDFETNYLKNPGSTRYDPYYTDYSNNDEARSLFGVNTFDQKWIDENRGYANYLTFSGENYTTPKKPGANASEEEKRAYQWWQIANTYEATTRAAENEYAQLRSEIQEMTRISRKSGDRLTADEILAGIDWGDYETLENLREASAAGNGRYLNRPVQVGDASLKSMVNAALRGEDITEARDFVYGESEYLKSSAANEKYLLQDEPEAQTPAQSRPQAAQISPYADVTSGKYDPYYGEGSNNTAARELFGVDVFDQNWIEDNRGLMAYIKFKDEDDTEPVKPGEDATEQEKAAYEYWKIANTYEETTRKAENELKTLQSWMEKQAEKLGEAATADEILDRIDWEDEDWQDEYPTLYNMREVAAAGNARLVNRPVGAGDESLRRMAESILGADADENVAVNDTADVNETQDANGKLQVGGAIAEEGPKKSFVEQLSDPRGNFLKAMGLKEYEPEFTEEEIQKIRDAIERDKNGGNAEAQAPAEEVTEETKTEPVQSEFLSKLIVQEGTTAAANHLKTSINYLNGLETQGQLTDELRAKRDEWQAEYDRLMDDVAERKEIEERVEADARENSVDKVVAPLRFLWNRSWTDALRDGEFVPTEDYEDYLRYRSNPAAAENAEEMAKYDRYSGIGERASLLAEGVATGMDKAATAVTGGLEYVLYTMARWNPATKDMTKDEVYASDRFLAALKGWNDQFDKQYIDEETKDELTAEYPVVALVSAGVSEMIKMVGQSIGDPLAMVGGHSYGDVAFRAGFQFLQNNGIALNTINKLGRYATNTMPFALDVYGSTYETAISEGATENQAAGAAALNGLFTGSISSWVTGRLTKPGGWLTRLFSSKAGQKAAQQGAIAAAKSGKINTILGAGRRLLESAIEEGLEEAIEVPIENMIAKGIYDRDRAWTGEGGVLDAKAMAESGIAGAVAGSMFTLTAGASGLMGKAAQTEAERILEKAENGEKIEQSEIDNLEKIEAREASIQDKVEEILQSDTSAIDAAEEKVNQAGQKAEDAERQLSEAQENKTKTVQAVQPTLDALNEGTASYGDPNTKQAIADARKQMQAATEQSQAAENAVNDARAEYEQMTAERDQTHQQAQEAARAQATREVEAELQAEAEAETQALAEAEQRATNEPETPGVKWLAKAQKSQLSADQRTQINILNALGEQYGVEIDIVDTLGPGKNGLYAGGRRVTVALDATESAYVQVGVHEMVHYIRGMDQDAYTVLEGVVESQAAGLGIDLNTLVRQRMDEYAGTQALSEEDAREEVIAEIVPQVLTNEESARVLVEQNKTLAQKIRDFFIDFTRKLKSIGERYAIRNDRGEMLMFEDNTEALIEIADVLDSALMVAGRAEKKTKQTTEGAPKYSAKITFADQLKNLREGVFPRNDHLYVMDTPDVLQKVGLKELPILMTQRHAKSVMKVSGSDEEANYHGLTITMMKQLPEAIENPAMIIKASGYDNRVVVITSLKDDSGNTVIAPIELDGKGNWQNVELDANILTTAYGKEKLKDMLMRAVMADEVLYADKKRSDALGQTVGVQFPKNLTANGGFIHSISDYAENVNEKYSLKSDEEIAQTVEDVKAEEKAEALDEAARIANQTVKKYKSTISRGDVAAEIDQMIDAYQNHDDAAAEQIADRLAKKVIEQSTKTDTSHQEGYEEIRRRLREKGFSLTDTQKQETANRYGSYNDWRKSIMGSVKIKNDAASLDAIWDELCGKHPEYFPADANEAQMPEYIEEFVRAMKPRYENRYGMDAASAAADLSRELQADVMEAVGGEGRAKQAAQLRADSETYRENIRVQTEERREKARQKRAEQFREIALQIKAGREAGDDTAVQNALAEYRKMMGGKSHAADAIDAGIEARRLRQEIRRITGIIENYSEMISGEDSDVDRKRLQKQVESYEQLRDQLQRQEAALHRQEVLERAGIPDDDMDPDAEALLAGEMQKRMDEDMGEVIIQRTVEMRGRVNGLWNRMKQKMKDFNQTSTISREDLAETFQDLESEIIQHSEMAKVWERRTESYEAQLFDENNELSYLRKELRAAKAKGDQASIATLQGLILEAEDRTDILGSQIRNAEAQAKYSRRIGAVSLDKALSEGKLPEPIMERIIGLCRDAGRRGAFNQNALVKAGEAIRLNTTTAARVYDDLFGDAAPLMRAIYYDPVMDNETDRQRWIKQWRDRIGALKLTKEQSALVQEIGEGRLNPQDARYQQADQTVLDAVKVFRQFYDEAHALASKALVRNGYERPGKITDYFPHIETQKTFWDKLGIPIENTSLPTSINGLTDTFTPGRQYSGHLEHRYGEKTDYDALFGFEQYIGGISNVIYHTDDIQRHRQLETEIRSAAKRGLFDGGQRSEHLSEFVKWIHEYTNLLAGKKSWVDRPFEGTAGRAIYSAATRLKGMKGASAVCGNLASAVTNMVPVTQVLAENPLATVKGVIQMCMGVSNGRGSIPESQYKIRKLGSDSVVETIYTRFTHFASRPFEWVDLLATNIVVNAYYQDNLQKGMDSETAMRSADSKAARLMGDRSKGAMPNIYGSQILGFFTQFQLEVANQSQHFRKDLVRAGGAKKAMVTLLASALTGYIWNEFNEWLTGRRPAADPFQIGMDVYQIWKNDGSPMEIGQAAYNGLSELFPYSNLGGRVAAFDGIGTFVEALTTEGNDGEDVRYALMQLGYGIIPGGGQLKKFVTGTKAQIDDGYYNTSRTQLRYALPDWRDDPLTAAQMILFGPSSTKAARDYYDGTAPGLTTAQTRNYEQARERGATSTEAYRNEADKAAAAKLESEISKTENAIEDAEAQARAGMEAPEIDDSQIEQQKADAAQLRSQGMPGNELTDFWWQRRNEPQVQAGIELWRKTGKTWALPYAYTANKSYTIDGRKEYLGEELLKEAEEMYEEGYMEIMDGVDPDKLDEEGYAELEEMLEDLKAEVNSRMKKRIRERNKEME